MRYDIRLRINHNYPGAGGIGRHQIRVVPADIPGRQALTVQQLVVTPAAAEYITRRDFFGNSTTMVMHDTAHTQMSIAMRSQVDILPRSGDLDTSVTLHDLPRDIASITSLSADAPHHFLGASPRLPPNADMAAYSRACVSHGMTTRDAVEAVGARLHDDLAFDSQATTVETPAAEAFAVRRGVCQDFTHIMIICLRSLGVPAAYVSGYLRTEPPPGQARLEGADAMHAWVRAWCGKDAGWVEYDPTNAVVPASDHVVVAFGRDYDDIAPVQGILRSSGPNVSAQSVDVVPAETQDRS